MAARQGRTDEAEPHGSAFFFAVQVSGVTATRRESAYGRESRGRGYVSAVPD